MQHWLLKFILDENAVEEIKSLCLVRRLFDVSGEKRYQTFQPSNKSKCLLFFSKCIFPDISEFLPEFSPLVSQKVLNSTFSTLSHCRRNTVCEHRRLISNFFPIEGELNRKGEKNLFEDFPSRSEETDLKVVTDWWGVILPEMQNWFFSTKSNMFLKDRYYLHSNHNLRYMLFTKENLSETIALFINKLNLGAK